MWGGALISTVLGTQFPGPGTIYIDQTLHFSRPVTLGDTITVTRDRQQQVRRTTITSPSTACASTRTA